MSASDVPDYKKGSAQTIKQGEVISASTVTISPPYDRIYCSTDCTMTFRFINNPDYGATTVTMNLPAGSEKAWLIDQVTALTGTAHGLRLN
jgi:hypothetical protein